MRARETETETDRQRERERERKGETLHLLQTAREIGRDGVFI